MVSGPAEGTCSDSNLALLLCVLPFMSTVARARIVCVCVCVGQVGGALIVLLYIP